MTSGLGPFLDQFTLRSQAAGCVLMFPSSLAYCMVQALPWAGNPMLVGGLMPVSATSFYRHTIKLASACKLQPAKKPSVAERAAAHSGTKGLTLPWYHPDSPMPRGIRPRQVQIRLWMPNPTLGRVTLAMRSPLLDAGSVCTSFKGTAPRRHSRSQGFRRRLQHIPSALWAKEP